MKARVLLLAMAIVVASVGAAPPSLAASKSQGFTLCTWGGTPGTPTGVFTASPAITNIPSTGPINFTVTGDLGGGGRCTGKFSFVGVLGAGTSCTAQMPFRAKATGLPPVKRAASGVGVAGTAPVLLYDAHDNVVGSEQAQFLTDALNKDDPAFTDCGTPEGLTRANWSDTVELFADH